MNGQVRSIKVLNTQPVSSDLAAFWQTYRHRQDILTLIRQLNQVSRAVQRHRGMSMALLAGSGAFRGDFEILQKHIERRLLSLQSFAEQAALLSERERQNLHSAWHTISAGWQDDDVIDNFELHSHFIEQLQVLISGLARSLERPVTVQVAEAGNTALPEPESDSHPQMFKQIEMLHFAVRQAPEMIEQVARIRGLATYAAAKGLCDYHHDRKLRYVITCARACHEKLRHQAERLESILDGAIVSLPLIKAYELKFMFLLNTVESDILSGTRISTSSHQLFKLATDIIDVYLKVVDEAVDTMREWLEQDLENWLRLV